MRPDRAGPGPGRAGPGWALLCAVRRIRVAHGPLPARARRGGAAAGKGPMVLRAGRQLLRLRGVKLIFICRRLSGGADGTLGARAAREVRSF